MVGKSPLPPLTCLFLPLFCKLQATKTAKISRCTTVEAKLSLKLSQHTPYVYNISLVKGGHCGIGYGEEKGGDRDVNDVRALCAPVGRLV